MVRPLGSLRSAVCLVLGLLFVLAVALTGPAVAQDGRPDYTAWEGVAQRAESALDAGVASDEAFAALRQDLTVWRGVFESARSVNTGAIAAVQAQIEALGPRPEEGDEAPETVRQRETLNTRLNELRSPGQRAEVAFSRADTLISQVDQIMRERQADRFLEIGPSPLNLVLWPPAIEALGEYIYRMGTDLRDNWRNPARRSAFHDHLPQTIILLTLAVVLIVRGQRWVEMLVSRLHDRQRTAERWLAGLIVSLLQIILPVIGLLLLTVAAQSTQLLGPRGDAFVQSLPAGGFAFFAALWLGGRLFPRSEALEAPLALQGAARSEGRFHSVFLGVVLLFRQILTDMSARADWAPEITNILNFPLLLVAALALFRLGQLLLRHARAETDAGEEPSLRTWIVSLLSRATIMLSVAGPVLAVFGYFNAGEGLVYPMISSLMLLALLFVLQRVINEIYILFTRNREGVSEALTPVLAGFALLLLSAPLFALIWGARDTDLLELWGGFKQGFTIGETRISPSDFLTFVVVFSIGLLLTRLLQASLRSTLLPKTKLDPGGQTAVTAGVGYLGIFAAALIAITSAGLDLSALTVVFGALSVGIGFGLQNIVSNFVSGIILLIERPVSVGDWIEVGGNMGFVRDISVRATRIETFDRTDVIVPNADLISGTVTNWTRGNLVGRLIVPVGVAYGSDTRAVEQILREVAEAQPVVLLNPPPFILFNGFGADSLNFEIRAILRDVTQMLVVQTEINHLITERFKAAGIEIPFAQRDIWLRNPEALRGEAAASPPPQMPPAGPVAPRDPLASLDATDFEGPEGNGDGDGDR
ncbi:DUF3772 domain-containing protein [Pseudooceanicola sp. C21-150M6]|uniref:DUF3772 domain-containing protein n=1 Tax=Pseudooceanicola sp. C21-150M6 TaxID=3434355 RepID=UPI003D7F7FB4